MSDVKIHIGCGVRSWPGWYNVDIANYEHIDHHDLFNLPFRDNGVDVIYASHLIAYMSESDVVKALVEWKRVLKFDGILRLATPDLDVIMKLANIYGVNNFIGPIYGNMCSGSKNAENLFISHKTGYTFDSLRQLLQETGFSDVQEYDFNATDHAQFDDHSKAHYPHCDKAIQSGDFTGKTLISLNVECRK